MRRASAVVALSRHERNHFKLKTVLSSTVGHAIKYVEPNGDDGNDGNTWGTAKQTIQAGINAATNEDVWVAQGTYTENISLNNGVTLKGGFTVGDVDESNRVLSANATIITAANNSADVVTIDGVSDATVDGFTISGGTNGIFISRSSFNEEDLAPAIRNNANDNGSLTISNNTISGTYLSLIFFRVFQIAPNGYDGLGGTVEPTFLAMRKQTMVESATKMGVTLAEYDGKVDGFQWDRLNRISTLLCQLVMRCSRH